MNRLLLFIGLFAIFGFVIIQSSAQNVTTELPDIGNDTTTTNATSTTTTTVSPTTTTTTQKTTPQPTTEPTLAPPTTPSPPEAPKNAWNVSTNGSICILAEFALTVRIEYNSSGKIELTGFNIPSNASVNTNNSFCSNVTQVLSLDFATVNKTKGSITFTFKLNQTKDSIYVEQVKLVYQLTEDIFPNYLNKSDYGRMITVEGVNLNMFEVDHSHAYGCNSQTSFTLNNTDIVETNGALLEITKAKVQAFMSKANTFSAVSECKADGTEVSDVVPIAVGASLAGLVIIVLIAYFVGRKRSRRLAYQSV